MTYSGYIAYDAQMARLEDELRRFRGSRSKPRRFGIRRLLRRDRA